ncbi:receptor-like kinase TMK2 [Raphanus sativus]|uniref:non-specific serine/threonine protein kinase n=1 Tax=Raphanus sativus TaxID=3726 RepID=A0A9W3C9V8_RAPSA|nr:receptor-like kinase TMK2 [Raphanus sativus]
MRLRQDLAKLTIKTLFAIAEDIGFPRVHAETWVGSDPCQWYGIECSDDGDINGITFINSNLTGFISPRFAEISSLTEINLAHNRLTGTIPLELLIKLKNLVILDVSYNDLHGKIPGFRKEVVFAAGNPQIETDRVISRQSFVWIGIGIGLLVAGVIGVLYYYLVILRKKSSDSETEPEPEPTIELEAQPSSVITERVVASDDNAIPFHILRDATSGFSDGNLIGRGGFSVVYRGTLPDGTDIAVKRMGKEDPLIGIDAFTCEVRVLSKIHHRNLVVLLGYCLEGEDRLLVYQLMHQGPLSNHLYHPRDRGLKPLDWTKRLKIALDVARGIEYLHTLTRQNRSYIHRDLKPSNILLGDDLRAKVSDFGLVRSTAEGKDSFTTETQAGTIGYLPPEYISIVFYQNI